MIYNTGWKPGKIIPSPTQEEILYLPEYFAFSKEEIYADKDCPYFLKTILDQYQFDGRNNVIQVRTQDFRDPKVIMKGDHWHTDIMVTLNDGKLRVARNVKDFHLMVCSWGDVVETEFMKTPLDMPDLFDSQGPFSPMDLLIKANSIKDQTYSPLPGQLVEYTSADIHKMGSKIRAARLRLMIVAFDCDSYMGGGIKLPSIKNRS